MPSEPLLRLIYLSQIWESMNSEQLETILNQSRRNNTENKLTGLLCYGGKSFVQVLEGPESAVIALYAKILNDERHHACHILDIHPASQRIFKDWAMAYVHASEADVAALSSVIENTRKQHPQAANDVAAILRKYIGRI